MIQRLLIGLDGSRQAESVLPYARALAHACDGEVLLVRAVTDEGDDVSKQDRAPASSETPKAASGWYPGNELSPRQAVRDAAAYLDAIGTRLNHDGIACHAIVASGDPADVLLQEAASFHADLIGLGTHSRSALGRWLRGSVTEAVLARSSTPVLLTRGESDGTDAALTPRLSSILVPLDGSPVAEAALPWAVELAHGFSAALHLLRVVMPLTVLPSDALQGIDLAAPVLAEDLDENAARDYLEDIARPLRAQGIPTTWDVRTGSAATGIVQEAEQRNAGLIVMATHGRTGLARVLMGSVALQVLHRGHWPLLMVRPPSRAPRSMLHRKDGSRETAYK